MGHVYLAKFDASFLHNTTSVSYIQNSMVRSEYASTYIGGATTNSNPHHISAS